MPAFMKDKTLVGGIAVMVLGAILIGIVWAIFLNPGQNPTAPLVAIPVAIDADTNPTIFEILPNESEVTFKLNETLRGFPTIVEGYSQQVIGQIAVDFTNPSASKIGPILINARTLFTDNEFRNNAIHNFILDTEAHEFIIFTPESVSGLPTDFVPNEPLPLQVEGKLTIRQITQPITFLATITPIGRSQLVGSATAQITRADFNLEIPNATGVANVSQEVTLSIHFTATPLQ
jgi:polyisoprenoid-binding protein YceI